MFPKKFTKDSHQNQHVTEFDEKCARVIINFIDKYHLFDKEKMCLLEDFTVYDLLDYVFSNTIRVCGKTYAGRHVIRLPVYCLICDCLEHEKICYDTLLMNCPPWGLTLSLHECVLLTDLKKAFES